MCAGISDIEDRGDCERLVRAFYGRALVDPVIGWIFVDVAKLDLEAHVPRIASFWETVLLGARSYSGGAFRPHAALNAHVRLRAGHFERWLWLWRTTVDELFAGRRAELAKAHAQHVAHAFYARLEGMPDASVPVAGGLTVTRHGGWELTPSSPAPSSGSVVPSHSVDLNVEVPRDDRLGRVRRPAQRAGARRQDVVDGQRDRPAGA